MSENEGHYLERLSFILEKYQMLSDHKKLTDSIFEFVENNHKPSWVDHFVKEVSELIVINLKEKNITEDEWRDIVWGLDYDILKQYNLIKYRRR